MLLVAPAGAEQTTLARLSFWVPPDRMEEFEAAYEARISVRRKRGYDGWLRNLRSMVDVKVVSAF